MQRLVAPWAAQQSDRHAALCMLCVGTRQDSVPAVQHAARDCQLHAQRRAGRERSAGVPGKSGGELAHHISWHLTWRPRPHSTLRPNGTNWVPHSKTCCNLRAGNILGILTHRSPGTAYQSAFSGLILFVHLPWRLSSRPALMLHLTLLTLKPAQAGCIVMEMRCSVSWYRWCTV